MLITLAISFQRLNNIQRSHTTSVLFLRIFTGIKMHNAKSLCANKQISRLEQQLQAQLSESLVDSITILRRASIIVNHSKQSLIHILAPRTTPLILILIYNHPLFVLYAITLRPVSESLPQSQQEEGQDYSRYLQKPMDVWVIFKISLISYLSLLAPKFLKKYY